MIDLDKIRRGPLQQAWKIAIRTVREFYADACLSRAAALSYTTLLAMIPCLAVSFSIYSSFGKFEERMGEVRRVLFQYINPGSIESLEGFYDSIIASAQQATAAIGVAGLPILILSAWALLNAVESSLNHIWHVPRARPIFRKFVSYTAIIFWIPLLITISIYMTDQLQDYFFGTPDALQSETFKFTTLLLPFLFTWGAFFFAFTAIPNCSVPWRASLIGSLISGLLWELAKVGFDYYIGEISSFKIIYGALGAIPLFLVWVYYSWAIVLLGAEVSFAIAHPNGRRDGKMTAGNLAPYSALRIMKAAAERFHQGEAPGEVEDFKAFIEGGTETAEAILARLVQSELLVRTGEPEAPRYTLAKAAERIPLDAVVSAVEEEPLGLPLAEPSTIDDTIRKVLLEARQDRQNTLARATVKDLLEPSS